MKDIIDYMPGAFIVYRADKENDEILLANNELLRLTGCKNMDELLAYTGKSFRNLIHRDEQESCQKSIWSQIDGDHSNDYIFFHMRKADGNIYFSARSWQDSGFSAQWQSILCDDHGLKCIAEAFWRLPGAGGEVEISRFRIICQAFITK